MAKTEAPINPDLQTFAARLRAAVADRGWNQAEFARRVGLQLGKSIDRRGVNGYFNGRNRPNQETMVAIAKALQSDITSLYPGYLNIPEAPQGSSAEAKSAAPGRAYLRIAKEVPWPVAIKILEMVNEEDTGEPN